MKILFCSLCMLTCVLFTLQLHAQTSDKASYPIPDFTPYLSDCANSERDARPQCSNVKLLTFIYNNTQYPKEAKDKQQEGMIVITFNVDAKGQMSDLQFIKKTNTTLDAEAMRVMKLVQKELQWSPAMKDGKAVKAKMTIPIKFKLESSKEEDQ